MSVTPEPLTNRYFALLYSPEPQKRVLEALLGIEQEITDSLRTGIDHQVAHVRLQWWREECERAANGNPVHPLARALLEALGGIKPAGLGGLVDVAVWDLAGATFETGREQVAYCERWAAAMFEPFSAFVEPSAAGELRALGAVTREIELLTELTREARQGRIRLALDELDRIAVDTSLLAKVPWPDTLAKLVRSRLLESHTRLTQALSGLGPELQPPLRGLLVWAALAARASTRLERALPGQPEPGRFEGASVSWAAWRAGRSATLKRFRLQ